MATGIVGMMLLVGFAALAWRFFPEPEPEPLRNLRATRAAGRKPISSEALLNIIRQECNHGDDPSRNIE